MEETRTCDNISEDCDDPMGDLEQVPYIGHQVEVHLHGCEGVSTEGETIDGSDSCEGPTVKWNLAFNWNLQIQRHASGVTHAGPSTTG